MNCGVGVQFEPNPIVVVIFPKFYRDSKLSGHYRVCPCISIRPGGRKLSPLSKLLRNSSTMHRNASAAKRMDARERPGSESNPQYSTQDSRRRYAPPCSPHQSYCFAIRLLDPSRTKASRIYFPQSGINKGPNRALIYSWRWRQSAANLSPVSLLIGKNTGNFSFSRARFGAILIISFL